MSETKPFSISRRLVSLAYQKVRSNKGAGGVDGVSLETFHGGYKDHLYRLWNRMSSGSYMPPPVRLREIPKKGGGLRPLGIPTVADRIAQTVVRGLLEPGLELIFHEDSYGYRPRKSAAMALGKARERCWKLNWVVDVDIKGYFDNIPHDLLMKAVKRHCRSKWMLLYIERWLKAPLQKEDGTIVAKSKGVPQGSVIGPRTHPQTLLFRGDFRSSGEGFDIFIKSSTFMINGKITEFRVSQADQSGLCSVVEGETYCRDSGVFDREIRSFPDTGISVCTASQKEQWQSGYPGRICGIYRQTAIEPDQQGEKVCTFAGNVDQQSGPVSAGRVSVKAGSWQKRRDKLKCRFATTGYGSKSSHRFIISLFHHRILVLSTLANPLLN